MLDFPAAVAHYARRFHDALGNGHHIASPLGAYLLLGLLAPLTADDDRVAIEEALGLPVDEARRATAMLLRFPHPAARLAFAAWHETALADMPIGDWLRELPSGVRRPGMPAQTELDQWAHEATHGMIPRFPGRLDPDSVLLLALALAARGRWHEPFDVVESGTLGAHVWPSLRSALRARQERPAIFRTAAAGLVGASIAMAEHGLWVVSVVAEPALPSSAVIAAAHEVARLASGLPSDAAAASLFDLPVEGHAWTITESRTRARAPGGKVETADVVIPAWTARSDELDLARDPAFGFGPTLNALQRMMPPTADGYRIDVRQSAMATFGRYGFEAAAVTSWSLCAGMEGPSRHRGLLRHATVRFPRPFAVVAVVSGPNQWTGVPVFSGWITTPVEALDADAVSAPA